MNIHTGYKTAEKFKNSGNVVNTEELIEYLSGHPIPFLMPSHLLPEELDKEYRRGISPKDYGAVGDGIADDSGPVQTALTEAAKGGLLSLSGYTYNMGTSHLTATLTGPLTIDGGGAVLIWNSGNGITLTQNNPDQTVNVKNISLYTKAKGTGVALEIIGSAQVNGSLLQPRTQHRGSISNLNIRGLIDTGVDGWGKGIRLVDIMNFMIDTIHIDGHQPTQGNFVSTHGIELVTDPTIAKAVDVAIDRAYIYLVQYALDAQGYEGVMANQCMFIGVGTGFRFDAADNGAPLASFTAGQIAFRDKGIEFIKSHQGVISDSLIYTHSTSGAASTSTGITLTDVTTTRITGITFVSNNGMQTGVLIQGALSKDNAVESSTFYNSITNPVVIGVGATQNRVRGLIIRSATQPIINNGGTTNTIELEDTGWITSGLTMTPAVNWTLTSYSLRKRSNQLWVRVVLTYTGPDIVTGVDGNLGDTAAITLPDGYRPIYTWPMEVWEHGTRTWGGFLTTQGVLNITNGLPSQTLTTGKSIHFIGTCMTN